jgi:hypothetical protein
MILRRFSLLLVLLLLVPCPAPALVNLNDGRDVVFVSGTYGIGFDSNVFTRAAGKQSMTQNVSVSADYTRQAGVIGLNVNVGASASQFESIRGQDFTDPNIAISLRKRHGRTTGALNLTAARESQPDPDVGERTRSWNYTAGLDLRYPVNDRYYLTNNLKFSSRSYLAGNKYADLRHYTDSVALNYIYTSKLDLNAAYSLGISDSSRDTKAYDHSLTVGASGAILAKLSGTIRVGGQRRNSESTIVGKETFDSFTSGTSLKWLFSRKLSLAFDLEVDNAMTATDLSVNRATSGLHATFSLTNKLTASAGTSYTVSDYLGTAAAGRKDETLQFNASLGAALTTRLRTSLGYDYSVNYSTLSAADYERHSLNLSLTANY